MICNVRDHRKRQHRWKRVKAIIEPAATESDYDERSAISIEEAIGWAHALPYAVTLYLYDED